MYNINIGGDIMKDGYIRVAAASFDTSIANVKNNSLHICELINQAYENNTKVSISRIMFDGIYL